MDERLLLALAQKNRGRPPIWLMRQAGRYLPEYRALREKYSLRELFFTPELAAEITCMPLRRFSLDAAILFSDISVIAVALGLKLTFREGPFVDPLVTPATLKQLAQVPEALTPIYQAIQLLQPALQVPLIGFCGAPFTVATYLVGGVQRAKQWLEKEPATFQELLAQIEALSRVYLREQVKRGVSAVQIFDSWANALSETEFREFSLPYLKRLVDAVSVPVLIFLRGAWQRLNELTALRCALSLGEERPLAEARRQTQLPLQGNLDPDLLFAPLSEIREKARKLIASMRNDPAFIVNLGHGVKPRTPVEAVEALVETVREERVT